MKTFTSARLRLLLIATALTATACGSSGSPAAAPASTDGASTSASAGVAPPAPSTSATSTPATSAELPRGGRTLFPQYRVVGFAGAPGSEAFGRLGIGKLDDRTAELEEKAKEYAAGRTPLPALELIATVSTRAPGPDKMHRTRTSDETVRTYLDAARRSKSLLLINIQPGRADFLPEVKAYEKWLKEPDVGLALDPEWAVGPQQVPGKVYGETTGKELDEVAAYVSGLVAEHDLPEKLLVFHQVAASIVQNEDQLEPHPGVVVVKSVDGIGSRQLKKATWNVLTRDLEPHVHAGFKLFFKEDVERSGHLMSPDEVLALEPEVEYVVYE